MKKTNNEDNKVQVNKVNEVTATPDEQQTIQVDSFIKIFDPESKEVHLETRA